MISKNCVALISLFCIAYPLSGGAAIYKCTGDNAVVYQDTPCKAGQTSLDLAVAPIRLTDPNNASPVELRQEPLPPSQLQSTALALGMSDTEVLNLRGWRRPGKITRSKANRA